MATAHDTERVEQELRALYAAPRGVDSDDFFRALRRELLEIPADDLLPAWQWLKQNYSFAVSPRLPDFLKAAGMIRAKRSVEAVAAVERAGAERREREKERREWAWGYLRSPTGQQAANGDWALELLEFLDEKGCEPEEEEIDAICDKAEKSYRERVKIKENLGRDRGDLNFVLRKFFNAILDRRRKINEYALGHEVGYIAIEPFDLGDELNGGIMVCGNDASIKGGESVQKSERLGISDVLPDAQGEAQEEDAESEPIQN